MLWVLISRSKAWVFQPVLWRLVEPFRPRRHAAVHACVGNRSAEVFTKVSSNGDEGATQRGSAVERFLWLVRIFLFEREDGIAEMRKRVLQGLNHPGRHLYLSAGMVSARLVYLFSRYAISSRNSARKPAAGATRGAFSEGLSRE
jgi:hypothetical protein